MDKFQQYGITIEQKEKKLVLEYLENIKNYISHHKIDPELFHDIEEMVFEKLSISKTTDQLSVKKILKEVGNPEDIFIDISVAHKEPKKEKTSEKHAYFYEQLSSLWWETKEENTLVLWVAGLIAEKLWISSFIVRWILFLMIFFGGIGLMVYFLLGMIFPIAGKNYQNKSEVSYLWSQFWTILQKFIVNGISTCYYFIVKASEKIWEIFWKIFSAFWGIIRIIFFGTLGCIFLSILISGIFLLGANYQWFFDTLWQGKDALAVGITLGALGCFFLMISSFWYAFKQKSLHAWIIITSFFLFFVSIFFFVSWGFQIAKDFSQSTLYNQKIIFPSQSSSLMLKKESQNGFGVIQEFQNENIHFKTTSGTQAYLEISTQIYGNSLFTNEIYKNNYDFLLSQKDDTLILSQKNQKNSWLIFALAHITYTFYLPETVSLELNYPNRVYLSGVTNGFDKGYVSNFDCQNIPIMYNKEKNTFTCYDKENYELSLQSSIENKILENIENWSPIQHSLNTQRSQDNMWQIHQMTWKDTSQIDIQYFDDFIDVKANLEIHPVTHDIQNIVLSQVDINHEFFEFQKDSYTKQSLDLLEKFR